MKKVDIKRNKTVIAELRESFFKNNKAYNAYSFGHIKYDGGEYTFQPTEADDCYTQEEKHDILENVLDEKIYISGGDNPDAGPTIITQESAEFLETYAEYRTNMYGGLYIIENKNSNQKFKDTPTEAPVSEDVPEEEPEDKKRDNTSTDTTADKNYNIRRLAVKKQMIYKKK